MTKKGGRGGQHETRQALLTAIPSRGQQQASVEGTETRVSQDCALRGNILRRVGFAILHHDSGRACSAFVSDGKTSAHSTCLWRSSSASS